MTPQPSSPAVLDAPSEVIFALEQEGFPQTDYAGFSFKGRCDGAALNQAFQQAQEILQAGRAMPLNARYALMRAAFEMRISFYMANLGVVWPKIEEGRPTGETAIRTVGGMDLTDIHTSVGTGKKNSNALLLRTFLDRLYLVFFTGRHKVADSDAEEFSALVVRKLLAYL